MVVSPACMSLLFSHCLCSLQRARAFLHQLVHLPCPGESGRLSFVFGFSSGTADKQ